MDGVGAAVQIDKTAESIKELQREIADYATGKAPAKPEEVGEDPGHRDARPARLVRNRAGGARRDQRQSVAYGRPDDYVVQRKARIEAMTPAQVQAAAAAIEPQALTWVIVGDLAKIETGVRALNLGEVSVVDADGKPVAAKK